MRVLSRASSVPTRDLGGGNVAYLHIGSWRLLPFFGAGDALAQKGCQVGQGRGHRQRADADQLLLGQSKNDANLGTVTLMTQRLWLVH